MKEELCEYFICFRGDSRVGGVIGEKIFDTIFNKYNRQCFFSSNNERIHSSNYREDEISALKSITTFIMVFSNDFFEGIRDGDEVLFEISQVIDRKDIKLVAVAERDFAWTEDRKNIIKQFFSKEQFETIIHIDYIPYYGVRVYSSTTEKDLLMTLSLDKTKPIISNVAALVNEITCALEQDLEYYNSTSITNLQMKEMTKHTYIAPNIELNGIEYKIPLHKMLEEKLNQDGSYAYFVIGNSGCGKSTLLRETFSQLVEHKTKGGDVWYLPIYIHMNNISTLNCNRQNILKYILDKHNIKYNVETLESLLIQYKLVVIVDALDEKSGMLSLSDIASAINDREEKDIFVFSCRKNFYQNLKRLRINGVIEILPLQKNKIRDYCKLFFSIKNKLSEQNIEEICTYAAAQSCFSNILILTYFLMYADLTIKSLSETALNDAIILDIVVKNIIEREIDNKDIDITYVRCYDILETIALQTYRKKGKGAKLDHSKMLQSIFKEFSEYDAGIILDIIDIFITANHFCGEYSFSHEIFMEYFIAKYFTDSVFNGSDNVCSLLDYTFSYGINTFITFMFQENGQEETMDELLGLYNRIEKTAYDKILALLNHMHRTAQYEAIKEFANKELTKSDDKVFKILFLHTLQVVGDSDDEELYYNNLVNDEEFARLNAGITLRYYNDSKYAIKTPYYDDGTLSWHLCFLAYKKHILLSEKIAHYFRIKRINFFTARCFIQARKQVDTEVAEFYNSIYEQVNRDTSLFGQKVMQEYLKLLETIKQFRGDTI